MKSKLFESNNKRNVLEDQNVDLEKELIKLLLKKDFYTKNKEKLSNHLEKQL